MKQFLYIVFALFLGLSPTLAYNSTDANFGGASFTVAQVSVTTSATKIYSAPSAFSSRWRGVIIRNGDSANPIYIGPDNTVTSGTGYIIKANEAFVLPVQADVWGIATGGTVVTYVEASSGTPTN